MFMGREGRAFQEGLLAVAATGVLPIHRSSEIVSVECFAVADEADGTNRPVEGLSLCALCGGLRVFRGRHQRLGRA
jgi:hypothetical protein